MTLGERLKNLRRELGLSQEAFGAQGFISAPGWIKIENGQRQASEKLIERITKWLVDDKYMRAGAVATLKEELLTLKYLGARSPFLRDLARTHAAKLLNDWKPASRGPLVQIGTPVISKASAFENHDTTAVVGS